MDAVPPSNVPTPAESGPEALLAFSPCGPSASVRRAQLLDRLLVILLPIGVVCAALQWLARPTAFIHFLVVLGAVAVGGVAWMLNRMDCFRQAALMTVLLPSIGALVSLITTPAEFIAFSYPAVGVLVAALLFSVRAAVAMGALNVVLLLALPLLQSAHSYPVVAAALGFNAFVVVLVVAGMLNLEREEADRQVALRESEERWRSLITYHPDPIAISVGGRLEFVNAAGLALVGTSDRTRVIGRLMADFAHPECRATLSDELERAARGERTGPTEYRVVGFDGKERRVEASSVPITHGEGSAKVTVIRDITDRWVAEQRLKTSEARYRAIVEHAPEAILVMTTGGAILECNLNAEHLFGRSCERLVGETVASLSVPVQPSGEAAPQGWGACVQKTLEEEACDTEWWFRGARGSVPCEVRLVRMPGSEPQSIRASITDITEKKRLELERRQTEAKIRTIIDQSSDLISVLDGEGRMVFESPSLESILGYTQTELLGRPVEDVLHPDDMPLVQRALAEGAESPGVPRQLEVRLRHKDGSYRIVEAVGQVLPESLDDWRVVVHSRDITERRRMESELLRISNREQRRLGRDLHDGMGQVLVGARLYAAGVERSLARKGAEETAGVREIGQMLDEAHELARALARGLSPVSLEEGGLSSALRDLADGVGRINGIDCDLTIDEPLPVGDLDAATHLYRIAQEALTNAARHAHARHVEMKVSRDEDILTLTIRDDGEGIRLEGRTPRGMGIPIMRKRATMLGGALDIRSDAAGTEVRCSFPMGPWRGGDGPRGGLRA